VKPRANIGFQQRRSFYISIATWLKRKVDREPSTSISAIDISTITRLTVELSWRNSSTAKRDDIKVQRLEPRRCEKIWYSLQVRVSELGTTAYGEPTRAQMEVASLESSAARSRSLAMASGITVSAPNYCGSRLDDGAAARLRSPGVDNAARRKNFHSVAAFDFRRQFVLNGTHAEYDRINALKLSRCSVRS
jgi:hypothetical protein